MKKRILAIVLSLVMVIGLMPSVVTAANTPTVNGNWIDEADTSWYNATDNKFTIDTAEQLAGLASLVNGGNTFENKKITLGANIDLAGKNWTSIGHYGSSGDQPVFSGEFDGNGKTISNLIDKTETVTKGFFGYANKSYIHNFTLENVYFSGETSSYVGSVVAMAYSYNVIKAVTVDTVTYALTTSGGNVGGMIGYSYESYVKNCTVKNATFDITTTASTNIGGVVAQGRGTAHDIENFAYKDEIDTNDQFVYNGETPITIYNYCGSKVEKLTVNVTGTSIIGGFLGTDGYSNWGNYSKECRVTDLDVTCDGETAYYVGGYMGRNQGADYGTDYGFVDCEVSGKITNIGTSTESFLGGFVGYEGGRASDYGKSTAAVDIKAKAGNVGGFTGGMQQYLTFAYSFVDCTANGDVSTENGVAGGFIGILKDYDGGQNINVTLDNCKAYGKVSGSTYVGGLWGYIDILDRSTTTNGIILTKDCTPATDIQGTATNSIVNLPKKYYVNTSDAEKYIIAPAVAWATVNGVNKGFATIREAVDAGAETVTLLQNASEDFTLDRTEGSSFTLALGEFTYSGTVNVTHGMNIAFTGTSTGNTILLSEPEKDEYVFDGWCYGSGTKELAAEEPDGYWQAEVGKSYHAEWTHSDFAIGGAALNFDFGTATYGDEISTSKQVTFTDTNHPDIVMTSIAENKYFNTSREGSTAIVIPKAGLSAGTYDEQITVHLSDGSTRHITAKLIVEPKDIKNAEITLGETISYTGEAQTQTVTGVTIDGLTVTYENLTGNVQKNVGTYTLSVTGTGNFTGMATKEWSIKHSGEVEFRKGTDYIQWRYVGEADTAWRNLIAIDELKGAAGTDGNDGLTPFIGENGNWWIGTTDTGVKAAVDGIVSAKLNENGELIITLADGSTFRTVSADAAVQTGADVSDNSTDNTVKTLATAAFVMSAITLLCNVIALVVSLFKKKKS